MATHKDDKKSDNVAKKKRLNASVISKVERVQMEKRKEARRKAKKKAQRKRAVASFVILIFLLYSLCLPFPSLSVSRRWKPCSAERLPSSPSSQDVVRFSIR